MDGVRLLANGPGSPSRDILWRSLSLCLMLFVGGHPANGRQEDLFRCRESDLVLYNLVFETHWTRQLFPKQYPQNRPPAHWSKMIGMTHDDEYVLFRVGEMADGPFKTFAETGRTEVLGGRRRGGVRHVLDEFSTSSIKTGAGRTQVNFFADGNHSKVSLAVKIVPSPDWFVGVDSLALCVQGSWLDSVTVEATPMDAGTDSGFTFTAPNMATEPQERISEITAQWPKHPANSFYYPKLQDLPVIATFHMTKLTNITAGTDKIDEFVLAAVPDPEKFQDRKVFPNPSNLRQLQILTIIPHTGEDMKTGIFSELKIDDGWIVPSNPYLALKKVYCHIRVEDSLHGAFRKHARQEPQYVWRPRLTHVSDRQLRIWNTTGRPLEVPRNAGPSLEPSRETKNILEMKKLYQLRRKVDVEKGRLQGAFRTPSPRFRDNSLRRGKYRKWRRKSENRNSKSVRNADEEQ